MQSLHDRCVPNRYGIEREACNGKGGQRITKWYTRPAFERHLVNVGVILRYRLYLYLLAFFHTQLVTYCSTLVMYSTAVAGPGLSLSTIPSQFSTISSRKRSPAR